MFAEVARGADLVSHEATFDYRNKARADRAQHSTASMAGQFCRRIGADWLFLTHFSSRYEGNVAPNAANNRFSNAKPSFAQVSQVKLTGFAAHDLLKTSRHEQCYYMCFKPAQICMS